MKELKLNDNKLNELLKIIESLNSLHDLDAVLNQILLQARRFCSADAGSIFLREQKSLKFSYFQNDTLSKNDDASYRFIYTKLEISIDSNSIAGHCALLGQTVNIPDVYKLPTDAPFVFNKEFDKLLNYKTISILAVPLITSQSNIIGVIQVINAMDNNSNILPFSLEDVHLVSFFATNAASAIEKAILTREIILRMIRMAELRDPKETGAHVNRVGAYSVEIYRQWAKENCLDENTAKQLLDNLRISAMLHDVGKVAISDLILKKPAKLDADEFAIMQTHTTQGADLFTNKNASIDKISADIALYHHEKYDGTGYPHGLSGKEIPLTARIVAIADVYDALICRRVYKEPWTESDVLSEIRNQSNRHFDPQLVEVFLRIYDTIRAIRSKYPETN